MQKGFYLPRGDKERRAWLTNFDTQIASIGATVGVTPAEITALHNDLVAVEYILDVLDIFKGETQERTSYKDLLFEGEFGVPLGALPGLPTLPAVPAAVQPGVFRRMSNMVQRIKHHPSYNVALGKNLGIIGAEKVIDYNSLKVQITLRRTDPDGIALDFVKGQMDGVIIYGGSYASKIVETTPTATTDAAPVMIWTEIVRATKSPYVDKRINSSDQPETRYYRMRYLKDDAPVGKISDTISVVATVFAAGNETATKLK